MHTINNLEGLLSFVENIPEDNLVSGVFITNSLNDELPNQRGCILGQLNYYLSGRYTRTTGSWHDMPSVKFLTELKVDAESLMEHNNGQLGIEESPKARVVTYLKSVIHENTQAGGPHN
jgi:hypothetical protein